MVTLSIIRYRIMQLNNVLYMIFFVAVFLSMSSQAKMQQTGKSWQGVVVRSGALMIASGVPITP
jgi:Na+/glutamate symporter